MLSLPVPPRPPAIRVHRVTSDSITLRWSNINIGNSPIISYRVKYKITYGDWTEQMVSWREIFRIIIEHTVVGCSITSIEIFQLENFKLNPSTRSASTLKSSP